MAQEIKSFRLIARVAPFSITAVALASFFVLCGRSMANDRPALTSVLNCPFCFRRTGLLSPCVLNQRGPAGSSHTFGFGSRFLIGGILSGSDGAETRLLELHGHEK